MGIILTTFLSALSFMCAGGLVAANESSCEKTLYYQYLEERLEFWQLVERVLKERRPALAQSYSSFIEYEKLNTTLKKLTFEHLLHSDDGGIDFTRPLLQWVPKWADCEHANCSNPIYEQLSEVEGFVELERRRQFVYKQAKASRGAEGSSVFNEEVMKEDSVAKAFRRGLSWNRNAVELGCQNEH